MAPPDRDRLSEIDAVLSESVKPARWPETTPVSIMANHLGGEPVPHDEAVAGDFVPFAVGDAWGPRWDTTWFHVTGSVPESWVDRDVVLVVHLGYSGGTGFGAEGQVWIDQQPVRGISPNHREVPVAAPAVGGESVDLYIEAAANPPAPAADPGPLLDADPGGEPLLVLRRCHLAVVDREVEALVRDWTLVREMVTWIGGERAESCAESLDLACVVIERGGVTAENVAAARASLAEVPGSAGGPAGPIHLAVGNSHLDTAWLWPLRETHRKAARTFSTAVSLLDSEPDYRFAASQPQQFAWIREEYPGLWERIRDHVSAGRFDVVGAMWVEPDCNIPSGESLVRQLVHGKRFFREEFGVETDGLWLPDVFGYSAALPQILDQAGVDWFLTQKISWNDTNRFPHHTFWWEGIDGTRIFTHFPPADTYSGDLSVANLLHTERNYAQRDVLDRSIYLYGHGDGGGGPDPDMLERARRLADLEGLGRVELTSAGDAVAALRAEAAEVDLPVWVGELYLELHRGTFTTHGAVKKANRELEWALREAEMWALAAHELVGVSLPGAELDSAWKTLLLNQFHDIIPGSSIHWVYEDAHADYDAVRSVTDKIIGDSLGGIAARVAAEGAARPALVANTLPVARDEVVEVSGTLHRLGAPPCGWSVTDLAVDTVHGDPPVTSGNSWMENGRLRIEWDAAGLVRSVRHLATDREVVAPGAAANLLQLMEDTPADWDAWDIDREAFATAVDLVEVDSVELVEQSPLRATLRVVRSFGDSRIEQLISLSQGSGRFEVRCSADWHEDHKLLKVAFPVDVQASTARHEIQFGHVERPTHQNTSWDAARFETCAHTWVDLSEEGFGVALLNDSKYGHDVSGSTIRLSLLRAPTWPDPFADRGRHTFAYALYPHLGSATAGGVIAEAHAFNNPLRVMTVGSNDTDTERGGVPGVHSLLAVDDPGLVVSALKAADDGHGTIVRLHEAFGGRRRIGLHLPGATRADRVDLLEEPTTGQSPDVIDGVVGFELRPFELVTLRIR